MTKRESREIITNIEKIAKRSKHITIEHVDHFYGWNRIDMRVTRETTAVVQELYNYLRSFCPFFDDDSNQEYGAKWFHSYDDHSVDGLEDGEYGFEICVMLWKKN